MNRYIGRGCFLHNLGPCKINRLFSGRRALDERNASSGASAPPEPSPASGGDQFPGFVAGFCTISTSIVIATSSPTTNPPPSIVAFHFTPKSCRLIFVVAFAAAL